MHTNDVRGLRESRGAARTRARVAERRFEIGEISSLAREPQQQNVLVRAPCLEAGRSSRYDEVHTVESTSRRLIMTVETLILP